MIQPIEGKSHLVIKRDGRTEPYSPDKLYAVILWACEGSKPFADQLIDAVNIKIHNRIKIETLYDEVIATAANLISDMFPMWERIAKNLYELKLHKELGVLRDTYPSYEYIIALNTEANLYNPAIVSKLDIPALSAAINQSYDKLFTFGGLNVFVSKYCNKHKGKLIELPQHVYMRTAIQEMYQDGTQAIIDKYTQLATHLTTEGTPKILNALRPRAQVFSCCLARPEDSLESINGTADLLARESKFGGGLATDISGIRAPGAHIEGNQGISSGVVPFVKGYQELIGGYNQGSSRSSALAVYYNWYHYQSPEITSLKEESGKDEDRARKLKYAVKWTKSLTKAILANEDVYLFDPHRTQDMTYAWGDQLESLMDKYSKNTHIRKRKYNARELAYHFAKVKVDTGNNYTFFTDNANIQNIGSGTITQSNLCMEYLPSFETIKHVSDSLVTADDSSTMVRTYDGDIALCNLSSINIIKWVELTSDQKFQQMLILVRSMDNSIDNAFYSNPLGKKHSLQHRNLGIGVSNYANWLASNQWLWSSEEARQATHTLFEEISYMAIKASIELAKEKSRYPLFHQSKWAQGLFPHEISILHNSDSPLNYPLQQDWDSLRKDLLKYGIRNEFLLAIAPTSTSGKCINATEGVDAPKKLKTIEEGTYSLPFVVPNLLKNRGYYQTRFNIPNKDVIELAAIRQKFIDMGQSVSLAYSKPDSAYEVVKDIIYAEQLGLKTLYYTHTPIEEGDLEEESCEGCAS